MPNDLKAGDTVRLIANQLIEAEVTSSYHMDPTFSGKLKGASYTNSFLCVDWERIPPPPFPASDLRVGDVIEYRWTASDDKRVGIVAVRGKWEVETLFRVWRLDAGSGDYKLIYKKED